MKIIEDIGVFFGIVVGGIGGLCTLCILVFQLPIFLSVLGSFGLLGLFILIRYIVLKTKEKNRKKEFEEAMHFLAKY